MTIRKMYSGACGFWADDRGQDLVEYALLAAMFAVAVGATFPPTIMPAVNTVFSKVTSILNAS